MTAAAPAAGPMLRLGVGAATGEALQLGLAPGHPSTHGGFVLDLRLDRDPAPDAVVTAAAVHLGYVHRGAEKLFEHREYRQILTLASRHEWLSAAANEIGAALVIEEALGMPVSPRATWLRMLVIELTRITHHHAFLCLDAVAPAAGAPVLDLVDALTGGRMHVAYARIGGVAHDLPPGFADRARAVLGDYVTTCGAALEAAVGHACAALADGAGRITPEVVAEHGLSGIPARCCGVPRDLRTGAFLAYDELFGPDGPGRVLTETSGDAAARYRLLAAEARHSAELALHILDRLDHLGPGPVDSRLPKVIRLPEGETWAATESGGGVNGYHLVSTGGKTPHRLAIRSASFASAQALPEVLSGTPLSAVAAVVGSMLVIAGDSDR